MVREIDKPGSSQVDLDGKVDRSTGKRPSRPPKNAWEVLVGQHRRGKKDIVVPEDLQPSYARFLRAFEAADVIMEAAIPIKIVRIVLFGSVARGTAGLDSDIDIAVIYNAGGQEDTHSDYRRLGRRLRKHGFRIGTKGEYMPLNIQWHLEYLYRSAIPPHRLPDNFGTIREIKEEGITLREGPPTS